MTNPAGSQSEPHDRSPPSPDGDGPSSSADRTPDRSARTPDRTAEVPLSVPALEPERIAPWIHTRQGPRTLRSHREPRTRHASGPIGERPRKLTGRPPRGTRAVDDGSSTPPPAIATTRKPSVSSCRRCKPTSTAAAECFPPGAMSLKYSDTSATRRPSDPPTNPGHWP